MSEQELSKAFKANLDSIFTKVDNCVISASGDHVYLKVWNMYSSPEIGFATLLSLSEAFGTTKINVDGFSASGCETCDYGSEYGHEIMISEPTKMAEKIEPLRKVGELTLWGNSCHRFRMVVWRMAASDSARERGDRVVLRMRWRGDKMASAGGRNSASCRVILMGVLYSPAERRPHPDTVGLSFLPSHFKYFQRCCDKARF